MTATTASRKIKFISASNFNMKKATQDREYMQKLAAALLVRYNQIDPTPNSFVACTRDVVTQRNGRFGDAIVAAYRAGFTEYNGVIRRSLYLLNRLEISEGRNLGRPSMVSCALDYCLRERPWDPAVARIVGVAVEAMVATAVTVRFGNRSLLSVEQDIAELAIDHILARGPWTRLFNRVLGLMGPDQICSYLVVRIERLPGPWDMETYIRARSVAHLRIGEIAINHGLCDEPEEVSAIDPRVALLAWLRSTIPLPLEKKWVKPNELFRLAVARLFWMMQSRMSTSDLLWEIGRCLSIPDPTRDKLLGKLRIYLGVTGLSNRNIYKHTTAEAERGDEYAITVMAHSLVDRNSKSDEHAFDGNMYPLLVADHPNPYAYVRRLILKNGLHVRRGACALALSRFYNGGFLGTKDKHVVYDLLMPFARDGRDTTIVIYHANTAIELAQAKGRHADLIPIADVLRSLSERGEPDASYALADLYRRKLIPGYDSRDAKIELIRNIESPYVSHRHEVEIAKFALGDELAGVNKRQILGRLQFIASRRTCAEACLVYGLILLHGKKYIDVDFKEESIVHANPKVGLGLIDDARRMGNTEAMYEAGVCRLDGIGCKQDRSLGMGFILEGANRGHIKSCIMAIRLLSIGITDSVVANQILAFQDTITRSAICELPGGVDELKRAGHPVKSPKEALRLKIRELRGR